MLSIVVCHSYFMRFDPKQRERAKPYPPLATLQVASLLRTLGHDVALFDAMLAEGVPDFLRLLHEHRPQLVLLYEDNYNFLSKMCLARMRQAACDMIGASHHAGARVIASGSDATDSPEAYLRAGADATLTGEGLSTLLQVVQRLDAEPGLDNIALAAGLGGIATLQADHVCGAGSKALPGAGHHAQAAWDLVDMEKYRQVWLQAHGFFSINMAASRGCPFRCTWCAKPIWGNQYLQRDAVEVAEEMIFLKGRYQPDHVWFADDIFGFRADWVTRFAQHLRERDGQIPFTIQTRADLITERMAVALAEAGCREAWIGAESGSQKILDAMNKGTTVAEILTARARLRAAGIRVGFFIQLGYLGEELDDLIATRRLVEAACPDDIGVSVSYPLPGTAFFELVGAQMRDQTHWQHSDDLAMMFKGTFASEFYREIRDLLHEQVASVQPNGVAAAAADAQEALDRRWKLLLARASQYRTRNLTAMAV